MTDVTEPTTTQAPVEEPDTTEAPVVEEPATEEPVTEEPVTEEPATTEAPAEEPATTEAPVEEPVVEEPVAEEPATTEAPVEEPAVEEPATTEAPVEEPVEDPVAEEPKPEDECTDPNCDGTYDPANDPAHDPTYDPAHDPAHDPTYYPTHDADLDHLHQLDNDLHMECDNFRETLYRYEEEYNKAVQRSHEIQDLDMSQFTAAQKARDVFNEYNDVLSRTGTPEQLTQIISDNNRREEEYNTAKDTVRLELESAEIVDILQRMSEFKDAIELIKSTFGYEEELH